MKIKADKMCELEKFGFIWDNEGFYIKRCGIIGASKSDIELYQSKYKRNGLANYYTAGITIFIKNRKIFADILVYSYESPETEFRSCDVKHYIQDLIKADMVEGLWLQRND